jgi:putative ABC transport system permease protein
MDTIRKDLQIAVRMLMKNPGFTLTAVLTLALGIAINATMFSLVSAFLLRRPPVHDPDRIAVVSAVDPARDFLADTSPVSIPNYLSWRDANHVFFDMAAADEYRTVNLTIRRQSEILRSAAVTPNYFSVLGVTPEIGRTFAADENQPGKEHVVILSHAVWARHFGSDPSVLHRSIRLNREDYSVVGVMPQNFHLLSFIPQVWTPLVLTPDQTAAARLDRSLLLFARFKPGATVEQARAEMSTLARRAEESFPDTDKGWGASARTLPDYMIYDFGIRNGLMVMMTAVGFVLLIACANVSGLLLARASVRRKELAIRRALGAGRLRIVRQLLTEGMLIACLGGGAGLLLANWGVRYLRANMNFNETISAVELRLDTSVLIFVTVISLACAVLCALAPALNASRTDITTNLKDESRSASAGRSQSRLRKTLVMGEIALALFLLIGTGLLIRGLYLIEHQNLGFEADHLLTAGLILDDAHYKDATKQAAFVRELVSRLRQIPGAESVAATSDLPSTGPATVTLSVQGEPDLPANQRHSTRDMVITPDFFRATGIPLLRGRTFTGMDDADSPHVVLINQEFARRFFAGQDPLGKQIRLDLSGASTVWSEIVGVAGNVKPFSESTRDDPEVYEPFLQRPVSSFSLMLRASADPVSVTNDLRETVARIDADLPLAHVMTMPAVIEQQRYGDPLFVRLMGAFALLALMLAAIGIYGLISYSVSQRTHEIGIRMALGARNQDVLRMILFEGVKMLAIGGAIGLALAVPLPKVLESMFSDLRQPQPWIYLIVPVVMAGVTLLASYVPAHRAARTDPMSALRQE